MNETELRFAILTLIKTNGSFNYLFKAGVSNQTIIRELQFFIQKGIIIQENNRFVLYDKSYMAYLNKLLKNKGLYKYMIPEYFYKIKKMEIEEIYVPLHDKK